MAVNYKPSIHAFFTEGESLTEQEHKDSCDINIMIKDAHRGKLVRGSRPGPIGYDDMTMDPVSFRIQKERLESELTASFAQNEFSPEELKYIPPDVQKKFKNQIKIKKAQNNDLNDDKGPSKNPSKPPDLPDPETPSSNPSKKDPV